MPTAQLQDHLYSLEERLLHPDREPNRETLESLLSEDFTEFCSSGKVFNRQQTMNAILNSPPRFAEITHFYVKRPSEDVALATYRVTTATSSSHRSSLWIHRDGHWQLLFHQGTYGA